MALIARAGASAWPPAHGRRGAVVSFLVALALYAPLAAWITMSDALHDDQVHYSPPTDSSFAASTLSSM